METVKAFMEHVVRIPAIQHEEWKYVVDPELQENSYKVSNLGRVKNVHSGRLLTPTPLRNGYWAVRMKTKMGFVKAKFLHILVAQHFLPKPSEDQHEVDHIDGNRLHNEATNLRWCTHKENMNNIITRLRRRKDFGAVLAPCDYRIPVAQQREKTDRKKVRKPPVRVRCLETDVPYDSLSAAARAYATTWRWILDSCRRGTAIGSDQHHFKLIDPRYP